MSKSRSKTNTRASDMQATDKNRSELVSQHSALAEQKSESEAPSVTLAEVEEFVHAMIRTADIQKNVMDLLRIVNTDDEQALMVAGAQIPKTEQAVQALAELLKFEPRDTNVPKFTESELVESRHFHKEDCFEVTFRLLSLMEFVSLEKMAQLCYFVQQKIAEPDAQKSVNFKGPVAISSIFDHVHLMRIEQVAGGENLTIKLVFYQAKRHIEKLK